MGRITLANIQELQAIYSVIEMRHVTGSNQKNKYQLLEGLEVELSNGSIIYIPAGFVWDLSSVPRFLWWLLPPDGDFAIAYLIHDYLYVNRHKKDWYKRFFCDREMLIWAKATSSTSKISFRNIDNYVRYFGVRAFGGLVWNDILKLK